MAKKKPEAKKKAQTRPAAKKVTAKKPSGAKIAAKAPPARGKKLKPSRVAPARAEKKKKVLAKVKAQAPSKKKVQARVKVKKSPAKPKATAPKKKTKAPALKSAKASPPRAKAIPGGKKIKPASKAAEQPKAKTKAQANAAPPKASPPPAPEKKVYLPNVSRPTGMYGGVLLSENPKPFPKKSPYGPKELSLLRQALLNERTRLRLELASLDGMTFSGSEGSNESPGHSVHIAEHASDMQSTETNIAMRTLDEERLAQVEEALQRMDERQQYGLCVACGEKIGIERLIAKPHAHLCMDCRRKYEKERRH